MLGHAIVIAAKAATRGLQRASTQALRRHAALPACAHFKSRSWNTTQRSDLYHRHFSVVPPPSSPEDESDPPTVPGVESPGDKFVMLYTCSVCETRAAKTISKHAYYKGVVLIRCPGCQNLHLIADRLGWFDDESVDVESILRAKGEEVKVVTNENVLELTDRDLLGKS